MTATVGWSQNVARQFRAGVLGYLRTTPSLYNLFRANALVENIGEGQDRALYLSVDEPQGGRLTSNIHEQNTIVPKWTEHSTGLDYLVARILLSKQDVDKHRTGKWLSGNLIQDTIDLVVPKMMNQFDQIIAWGQEYADSPDNLEVFSASGAPSTITGIFNGGTELKGGIGKDDDLQSKGDYVATVENHRNALRQAKHELNEYITLSDLNTYLYAALENQFYETAGTTERQRVLEYNWIKEWMNSVNFTPSTSTKYRMAMIAPRQRPEQVVGGKGPQENFKIFTGYDFAVYPNAGGELVDNYYVWFIAHSFKFVELRPTAIQRTGDLTLT